MNFGLSDEREQYTRGFRETAGILGREGVYLAGSGFWYPSFNRELLEFTLDVQQPDGWHVVSQGNGTSRDEQGPCTVGLRRRDGRDLPGRRAAPGLA